MKVSPYIIKAVGAATLGGLLYYNVKDGKRMASIRTKEELSASYCDTLLLSKTANTNSSFMNKLKNRLFLFHVDSDVFPVYKSVKNTIGETFNKAVDNILPIGFAALALATKAKRFGLPKPAGYVGLAGLAIWGLKKVFVDLLGFGRQDLMKY